MTRSRTGAAIEQVLIATAVLAMITITVAKLATQMDLSNVLGRDNAVTVNLRNQISSAHSDLPRFMDMQRQKINSVQTCMPDESTMRFNAGTFDCSAYTAITPSDAQITKLAAGGTVSRSNVYDPQGNLMAKAFDEGVAESSANSPVYYDPSGKDVTLFCLGVDPSRPNALTQRNYDCRFMVDGFLVRENAVVQSPTIATTKTATAGTVLTPNPAAGPGQIRYILRIRQNTRAGQANAGSSSAKSTPLKTVYQSITVGNAWRISTLPACEVGKIRVGYYGGAANADAHQTAVCADPITNECAKRNPTQILVGYSSDTVGNRQPVCKDIPDCGSNTVLMSDGQGQLACSPDTTKSCKPAKLDDPTSVSTDLFVAGLRADHTPICFLNPQFNICPLNKHIVGYNDNGTAICDGGPPPGRPGIDGNDGHDGVFKDLTCNYPGYAVHGMDPNGDPICAKVPNTLRRVCCGTCEKAMDTLFVIDDSSTMGNDQVELRKAVNEFFTTFSKQEFVQPSQWHMGVTSVSVITKGSTNYWSSLLFAGGGSYAQGINGYDYNNNVGAGTLVSKAVKDGNGNVLSDFADPQGFAVRPRFLSYNMCSDDPEIIKQDQQFPRSPDEPRFVCGGGSVQTKGKLTSPTFSPGFTTPDCTGQGLSADDCLENVRMQPAHTMFDAYGNLGANGYAASEQGMSSLINFLSKKNYDSSVDELFTNLDSYQPSADGPGGYNRGFLRQNGFLHAIVVTDEDESGAGRQGVHDNDIIRNYQLSYVVKANPAEWRNQVNKLISLLSSVVGERFRVDFVVNKNQYTHPGGYRKATNLINKAFPPIILDNGRLAFHASFSYYTLANHTKDVTTSDASQAESLGANDDPVDLNIIQVKDFIDGAAPGEADMPFTIVMKNTKHPPFTVRVLVDNAVDGTLPRTTAVYGVNYTINGADTTYAPNEFRVEMPYGVNETTIYVHPLDATSGAAGPPRLTLALGAPIIHEETPRTGYCGNEYRCYSTTAATTGTISFDTQYDSMTENDGTASYNVHLIRPYTYKRFTQTGCHKSGDGNGNCNKCGAYDGIYSVTNTACTVYKDVYSTGPVSFNITANTPFSTSYANAYNGSNYVAPTSGSFPAVLPGPPGGPPAVTDQDFTFTFQPINDGIQDPTGTDPSKPMQVDFTLVSTNNDINYYYDMQPAAAVLTDPCQQGTRGRPGDGNYALGCPAACPSTSTCYEWPLASSNFNVNFTVPSSNNDLDIKLYDMDGIQLGDPDALSELFVIANPGDVQDQPFDLKQTPLIHAGSTNGLLENIAIRSANLQGRSCLTSQADTSSPPQVEEYFFYRNGERIQLTAPLNPPPTASFAGGSNTRIVLTPPLAAGYGVVVRYKSVTP